MNEHDDSKDIAPFNAEEVLKLAQSLGLDIDGKNSDDEPPIFSIKICLEKNGYIKIAIDSDFVDIYSFGIAEILYRLTNGDLNEDIYLTLSDLVKNNNSKFKTVDKVLKRWESLENVPFINPLQSTQDGHK